MLIDATHLEETRVVVADGNKVNEFDFESINKRQLAGNIYLAKVTRVEPSLQAAFVDYGGNRHGFLAFSEIHPDYYQIPVADREALLAEEAAEQERSAASEEEAEEKPKSRPRRSKRRARGQQDENSTGNSEVKGLEVIELSEENSNHVETTAPAEIAAPEIKGLEIAGQTYGEVDSGKIDTPADEAKADSEDGDPEKTDPEKADPEKSAQADSAPEATDEPSSTPKSIAEAAGLDDEDSVSEDIADTPTTDAKTVETKPADEAPVEATPEKTTPEKTPAVKAEAPAPEPVSELGSTESNDTATAENTPAADDAGEQPAGEEAKKPARSRKRRTRSKDGAKGKGAEEGEETPVEVDEPAEAVESMGADDTQEEAAQARAKRRRHYKIQDVVKVRQIMLVQVVKEERGNKGAALTTYLSLAGRYCVLMPNTARGGGISRKITSAGDRKRLRDITAELEVPNGIGLIVRTAGAERTRAEIKRDYEFLIRQWEQIRELTLKSIAPSLIYEEGSLIKRSIRDLYSNEIEAILVEGEEGYREAKDYMKMLMPSHAKNVQRYDEQIPLYIRYQVESYLNAMFNPTVQLRSGGYIVIGITEALVAIDVNSGRSTKEASIEETALKTNLEAAEEVARQLRLRDLAGLIVIDFIDMEDNRNNRAVEKRMKDRLKSDRARIQVGRISAFGLMEMSRQRLRPGMLEATTQPCPHCHGQGIVRSEENLSLAILREVEEEGVRGRSAEVTVTTPVEIANYIMNMKRVHLAKIELRYGLAVTVHGDPTLISPEYRIDRSRTRTRQIEAPDLVITAESAASESSLETVETVPASVPEEREDRIDEKSEGRSRRRRGKRGGQRRRREEGENDVEDSAAPSGESTGGESAEGDRKPSGEGRSRRRRGGRGRSRRDSDEVVAEETAATEGATVAAPETADTAPETAPETVPQPVSEPATLTAQAEVPAQDAPVDGPADEADTGPPPETVVDEPEAVAELLVEPVPEPEPVTTAPAEPEPEKPAAPKRRGWWSRG
jgi:ribonuclease E